MPAPVIQSVFNGNVTSAVGIVNVTIPGFGVPDAVIIQGMGDDLLENGTNNWNQCTGFATRDFGSGIKQGSVACRSENNQVGSVTSRSSSSSYCILLNNAAGDAHFLRASVTAFITDGVTVQTFFNSGSRGYIFTFIKGLVNATVVQSSATNAASVNVGFPPDVLMAVSDNQNTETQSVDCQNSTGFAARNSGNQGQVSIRADNGVSTSKLHWITSNTSIAGQVDKPVEAPLYTWEYSITGWTATGWTGTGTNTDLIYFLAMQFDADAGYAVVTDIMPAGAGNYDISGLPFTPTAHLAIQQQECTAFRVLNESTNLGVRITHVLDPGGRFHISQHDENGQATTDTRKLASLTTMYDRQGADNTNVLTSWAFNADGMTMAWSAREKASSMLNLLVGEASGVKNIYKGSDQVDTLKLGVNDVGAVYVGTEKVFG
jgi:hypothetical protein